MRGPRQKIVFRLVQDEHGYPPAAAESVWASEASGGHYRLDNIPFFATQATLDDVVRARERRGELVFEEMVRRSGNSLIRVVCCKGTDPGRVRDDLERLGCSTEWMAKLSLIAVNVPSSVALGEVQKLLDEGAAREMLDYQEAILRQ